MASPLERARNTIASGDDPNEILDASVAETLIAYYPKMTGRQSIFSNQIMETSLREVLENHDSFFNELSRCPGIGKRTVDLVAFAVGQQREKVIDLLESAGESFDTRLGATMFRLEHVHNRREDVRILSLAASFSGAPMSVDRNHPLRLLGEEQIGQIYYLPISIPDFLMTRKVWNLTYAKPDKGAVPETLIERFAPILSEARVDVTFVLDSVFWQAFRERSGPYAQLSEHDVNEQIDYIRSFVRAYPAEADFKCADFRRNGLANSLIAEGRFVSTYAFGGYILMRDIQMVNHALSLVERARPAPLDLGPV